ncbi:glutamyl-tRNA reductase [Arthrobacter sp. SLBN-100]|uniref:hypothetical protein n=1 Tax=Arthrobacter sp. SLBN-100 TaxID=2768450 RepID=UPI001151C4D5
MPPSGHIAPLRRLWTEPGCNRQLHSLRTTCWAAAGPQTDAAQIQLARTLIRQSACRFHEQESLRTIDAAIIDRRHHLHRALEREMEKDRKRNGAGTSAEETARVLRRFVRQVLHTPAVRAREMAAAGRHDEYTAALETLFGISVNVAHSAGVPNAVGW